MRFYCFSMLAIWLLASRCPAQLAPFVPCQFGKSSIIGHTDGITVQRVNFLEPSGAAGASVFIPDADAPVPGVVFSHSDIHGANSNAELRRFALALARGGAASIVLDGTIEWQTPNDDSLRSPHLMACVGQWLLLNAKLDQKRLAVAGPMRPWGGGVTPICLRGESPCWHPHGHLNFGETSPAEFRNTESMLTIQGQFRMAKFAQEILKLEEMNPQWFSDAPLKY